MRALLSRIGRILGRRRGACRIGVCWAMNWGGPKSWGLVALLVAAVAAFVAVVEVLLR